MLIGLIPDCDLARVTAVGNAAGDGARMILLDKAKRSEARWAARWVRYVETAVEPSFQDEFVAAISFPHATDSFPHLQGELEASRNRWSAERIQAIDGMENGTEQRSSRTDRLARRRDREQRRG